MFSSTWRGFVVHTYPHPSLARTRDRGALLPTLQIVYDTKRSDALLVPLFCFRPGVQGLFSFFSFSKSTNYFLQLGYDATRTEILLVTRVLFDTTRSDLPPRRLVSLRHDEDLLVVFF